jgi:hypothetical protein
VNVIWKVQDNQTGLKRNGIYQLLDDGDDVNLPGKNMKTTKKNMEAVRDTNKEVVIEIDTEKTKTKCLLMTSRKNAKQNHIIKMANRPHKNVVK